MSDTSLTIVRRIKATPETVFAALTRPEQIVQWWGPDPGPVLIAETDLRVGGRFRVEFWGQDDQHHKVSGVYREVVPNRKLVFSWAWQSTPERESQVTIDLNPVTDGTMLTLTHEQFFDQKACDDHKVGWERSLDNLEKALA